MESQLVLEERRSIVDDTGCHPLSVAFKVGEIHNHEMCLHSIKATTMARPEPHRLHTNSRESMEIFMKGAHLSSVHHRHGGGFHAHQLELRSMFFGCAGDNLCRMNGHFSSAIQLAESLSRARNRWSRKSIMAQSLDQPTISSLTFAHAARIGCHTNNKQNFLRR